MRLDEARLIFNYDPEKVCQAMQYNHYNMQCVI